VQSETYAEASVFDTDFFVQFEDFFGGKDEDDRQYLYLLHMSHHHTHVTSSHMSHHHTHVTSSHEDDRQYLLLNAPNALSDDDDEEEEEEEEQAAAAAAADGTEGGWEQGGGEGGEGI